MVKAHSDLIAKVSSYIEVLSNLTSDQKKKNVFPTFAKDYNTLRVLFLKYYPSKKEFCPPEIIITETSGLTQVFANYSEILTYSWQLKNMLDSIEVDSMD